MEVAPNACVTTSSTKALKAYQQKFVTDIINFGLPRSNAAYEAKVESNAGVINS
jgi:hypothetical protein